MRRLWKALFVLFSVVMVTGHRIDRPPSQLDLQADKTYFEFDDIYDSEFRPKAFDGKWFGDVLVYKDSTGSVNSRDMANNQTEAVLVPADIMTSVSRYFVSPDLTEVLLATKWKQVWRHSFTAVYHVYNVKTRKETALHGGERLQYCNWAPADGKLVYVYGNNFYVAASSSEDARKITHDGNLKTMFNGIPDWLYEEDVLTTNVGHYWSPDARYVIMAKFNDTKVPLQKWKVYGEVSDVYGSITEIAYPKAGYVKAGDKPGDNTIATLHVLDTDSQSDSLVQIIPPDSLKDQDHYYTRVGWINSSHVVITWTNRVQNESVLQACHVNGTSVDCYDHYSVGVSRGWIDSPWPKPVPVTDQSYVTILSKDEGETGPWKHLALMDLMNPSTVEPVYLTSGEEEISGVVGFDSDTNHVYYLSTGGDPIKRHLYKLDLTNLTSSCVSCDISAGCQYVSASMAPSGDWYTLACLGPDLPTYSVRSTRDHAVAVMEDNSAMKARLASKHLATRDFMTVEVGGGYKTTAEIFKPPNFDAEQKYPLLIFVYAGPNSQKVHERFYMGTTQTNWMMHLKSKHGVVVASVDGRGALGRGDKYKFEIYRRLGTVEVEDQITVAKYLKDNLGYIDKTKDVAVYGWSYGGQTSSHILVDADGFLNCAIAVAPVASKMYYDTAYTERYMGLATKSDNEAGYNETEVWPKASKFKGKKYLIAHGTADDNVHFMHAAHLINELVKAEVQFHQLIYMDENHSIGTRTHSRHLFRAMTDFLVKDCWELHKEPEITTTEKPTDGASMSQISQFLLVTGLLTWICTFFQH